MWLTSNINSNPSLVNRFGVKTTPEKLQLYLKIALVVSDLGTPERQSRKDRLLYLFMRVKQVHCMCLVE